jgi:catechol 2,3-dioxygenase-like lactoylglutathione lyase family enzyme
MENKDFLIGHVGLFTSHPRRMINFYTNRLGFAKDKESYISGDIMERIFGIACGCRLVRFVKGNARVEIFIPDSLTFKKKINKQIGYNHYSLVVSDKIRFCSSMAARRVGVIKIKRENHTTYFIKDPDGNRIEIQD